MREKTTKREERASPRSCVPGMQQSTRPHRTRSGLGLRDATGSATRNHSNHGASSWRGSAAKTAPRARRPGGMRATRGQGAQSLHVRSRAFRPTPGTTPSSILQLRRKSAPPARSEWNTIPTCATPSAARETCSAARKAGAAGNSREDLPPGALARSHDQSIGHRQLSRLD